MVRSFETIAYHFSSLPALAPLFQQLFSPSFSLRGENASGAPCESGEISPRPNSRSLFPSSLERGNEGGIFWSGFLRRGLRSESGTYVTGRDTAHFFFSRYTRDRLQVKPRATVKKYGMGSLSAATWAQSGKSPRLE